MITDRRSTLLMLGGAALGTIGAARQPSRVRRDLYVCEGCEAVAEQEADRLSSVVRLAPTGEPGEALILSGRVLTADGARSAPGAVIYAHHTDHRGFYSRGRPTTEWSRRHGLLRGWARTDAEGRYTFITIKPAPYPGRNLPAHVHFFIGEEGRRPYYIDDVVFAGEYGVTRRYIDAQELRGGSGIVRLARRPDGTWLARRDIRLEPHLA